jgi:hypothetical protein
MGTEIGHGKADHSLLQVPPVRVATLGPCLALLIALGNF